MTIERALISVSDKTGVLELARELVSFGVEIVSTGGTARVLCEAGVLVSEVSELTGFPELFDGRVKTLHPAIHGGILHRRNLKSHSSDLEKFSIKPIDLVVVNLYPFEAEVCRKNASVAEILEQIDIGGPALLRSAAKNHADVIVITDPCDYALLVSMLKSGQKIEMKDRQRWAAKVFSHTSRYDFQIEKYLKKTFLDQEVEQIRIHEIHPIGRYGENWHQTASVGLLEDSKPPSVRHARQLRGIALSYNNYLDGDAALQTLLEFEKLKQPVTVIVKHGNPCGVATASSPLNSLERAWQGDSISAFGSVIAMNRELDLEVARALCDRLAPGGRRGWFVELILAPSFSCEALDYFDSKKSKSKLRLLESGPLHRDNSIPEFRSLGGSVLIQSPDHQLYLDDSYGSMFERAQPRMDEAADMQRLMGVVSRKLPSENLFDTLDFSFRACKYIKSNAISICRRIDAERIQLLGIGSGQPNRKDSAALALKKARENLSAEYRFIKGDGAQDLPEILKSEQRRLLENLRSQAGALTEDEYIRSQLRENCAVGSDAFFPFADGVAELLASDLRHFIQSGGSLRDAEVIETIDQHQAVMLFAGMRHFKH